MRRLPLLVTLTIVHFPSVSWAQSPTRIYDNTLTRLKNPAPILADHPEFIAPVKEHTRFQAPALIDEVGADLEVRAWRFSYNARGIVEMPNRLLASRTAVIMVHPCGIDDGQGWQTPEPAGDNPAHRPLGQSSLVHVIA